MRCPSCAKFTGIDISSTPEVGFTNVDDEGNLEVEIRIALCCEECGDELKEYSFDVETQVSIPEEHPKEHDLIVDEGGGQILEKKEKGKKYYGYSLEIIVTCTKCKVKGKCHLEDYIPFSEMEEI